MLVSEYRVSREYGGPEEGGWWYDWLEFVRTVVVVVSNDKEVAGVISRCLNAREHELKQENREPDRFSMAGGADKVFYIENEAEENNSTERPRYE